MTDNDREPIERSSYDPPDRGTTAPRRPLRRPRDRILGGVCAAIADHLGVDVALVRLITIALVILTGGTGLFAYLLGWLLIPKAEGAGVAATPSFTARALPDPRGAWRAAGADLRSLRDAFGAATPSATPAAAEPDDRPLARVDAALTGLGERLRDPQVQASARQAATGLSTAVGASIDGVTRRGRHH